MANRRIQSYTAPAERTVRASVSFPEDQYAELEEIALAQRVSLAWVVREAVQSYLVQRLPQPQGENTASEQIPQGTSDGQ
jgi:metal-responsive CopG/Arc/MetJ family transcriptional regulator